MTMSGLLSDGQSGQIRHSMCKLTPLKILVDVHHGRIETPPAISITDPALIAGVEQASKPLSISTQWLRSLPQREHNGQTTVKSRYYISEVTR